jgi:hypothetical protein
LQEACGGVADKAQLDNIGDALGEFDFDKAGSLLAEIAQACGVNGE